MPNHGRSAVDRALRLPRRPPTRWPACSSPTTRSRLVGHSMGGKIAMLVALRHPELVERLCVVDVSPVAYEHAQRVRRLHRGDAGARPRRARAPQRGRRALADAVPEPDGAQLPAAEPPPRRRRVVAGSPTSTCSAATSTGIGGWPEDELADTAPYDGPGAVGRRREVALRRATSTSPRWTAGSRATAGSPSRTPATGCTPSSRRCSSRCCAGSSPSGALGLLAGPVGRDRVAVAAGGASRTGGTGCGRGRGRRRRSRRRRRSPSRDISSARITSTIAMAVSTAIRVGERRVGGDGVEVPVRARRAGPAGGPRRRSASIALTSSTASSRSAVSSSRSAAAERAYGVQLGARRGRAGRCSRTRPRTRRGRRPSVSVSGSSAELTSIDGGLERHLGVMGENHVDRLQRCGRSVMIHDAR